MSKAKGKRRASDHDEDATESQKLIAFGKQVKQQQIHDKETEQFRQDMMEDRRQLSALLDARVAQAEEAHTRRYNELSTLITNALTKPNRATRGEPSTYPTTTIATNAIFDSVNKVEAACATLTKEYAAFDELMETMAADERIAVLMKEWTSDIADAERRLRLGHRTAVRNVKKVLGGEVDEDGEEEQSQEDLNMQLLNNLQYAERGVKRMVKGLPPDE